MEKFRIIFTAVLFILGISTVNTSAQVRSIIQITDDPSIDSYPSWSPDGGTIVFHSNRSGNFAIYSIPAVGGEATRLTNSPGHQAQPCYSPNGEYLAFVGIPPDGKLYKCEDIFALRLNDDPNNNIKLTDHPGYDALPSWSPDGTLIAYTSTRKAEPPYREDHIWIQPWPTGEPTRITDDDTWLQQSPAWSPDGSEVAYHAYVTIKPHDIDIMCISSNGGQPENITNTPDMEEFSPSWSPDGKYIAFDRNPPPPEPNRDIYVIPRKSGEAVRLTTDPAIDSTPRWSPTGDRIAFVSNRTGNLDIFVLYLDSLSDEPCR